MLTGNNPLFEEALMFEDMNMIDEMDQLIETIKENGGVVRELTDLDIRRMVLRRKYMQKNIEKLKALRDAVQEQWNAKIKKEEEQLKNLESVVFNYAELKGENIVLDVATVSTRRNKHKVQVVNSDDLVVLLQKNGGYENFLTEPKFDETKARNYYIGLLDAEITKINEAADEAIKAREAAYHEETKDIKKAADKKPLQAKFAEDKKAILQQADIEIQNKINQFQEWLPDSLKYEPETKSLSIRMS